MGGKNQICFLIFAGHATLKTSIYIFFTPNIYYLRNMLKSMAHVLTNSRAQRTNADIFTKNI